MLSRLSFAKRIAKSIALALLATMAGCGTASARRVAPPAGATPSVLSDVMAPQPILHALITVANWQLENPSKWPTHGWQQAAFWAGMAAFASLVDDPKYLQAIQRNGEANDFKLGPRPAHADDQAIAQSYFVLYEIERDPRTIAPALARFDEMIQRPFNESLEWSETIKEREWAWCDALFMAPPALAMAGASTGQRKYIDFMNRLWWKTTDFLLDKDEHLYFRDARFFDRKEPNGKKTFWSRGNGWVLAGLARVLQYLPEGHPERGRYVTLFRDMASKIAALQAPDGYWRASLLDPASYPGPESSGTGFFAYALAWGVNQGLLERAAFEPVIRKGWTALVRAVQPSGMLGFVQRVGDRPGDTTADRTEVYGAGAFLLAGSELYRLVLLGDTPRITRALENRSDQARLDEVVEVPLDVAETQAVAAGSKLVAVDGRSGAVLPSQLHPLDRLLVLVSFLPADERTIHVHRIAAGTPLPRDRLRAFGRHVPERKDDFAWENERIAFRVYGPALASTGEISSGIDVWAKRVRTPIIDRWYERGDYHEDHGDGLDFYKVGPSRGCGGIGLLDNDKLLVSGNYRSYKRIAAGPLRVEFELTYDPWGTKGAKREETKHISLDAGTNLSRIEVRFGSKSPRVDGATPAAPAALAPSLAIGIQHHGDGPVVVGPNGEFATYWEPPQEDHGQIGCAVVLTVPGARRLEAEGQTLLVLEHWGNPSFVYFAGAAWSKGLDFHTADEWTAYVKNKARNHASPIRVTVAPKVL
jgi:unsaturated rhamnogalacturonyl hydrolase